MVGEILETFSCIKKHKPPTRPGGDEGREEKNMWTDRNILVQWEGEDYGDHYWVASVQQARDIIPDDYTGYRISEHLEDGTFEIIEEDGNLDNFGELEPTNDNSHMPFYVF